MPSMLPPPPVFLLPFLACSVALQALAMHSRYLLVWRVHHSYSRAGVPFSIALKSISWYARHAQPNMLSADPLHPLHEDAVCRHQLPPNDSPRVPPRVHASVLPCRRGGPCCARCGRHCAAAGVQRGLHCGAFVWHLCGVQAVSTAPLLGAVIGESAVGGPALLLPGYILCYYCY